GLSPRLTRFPYATLFRSVVELELLERGQVLLLGLLEPGQHRPHRRDLERVRGDEAAADLLGVVVLDVDLDLFLQLGDVRNVDLEDRKSTRLNSSHVKISY